MFRAPEVSRSVADVKSGSGVCSKAADTFQQRSWVWLVIWSVIFADNVLKAGIDGVVYKSTSKLEAGFGCDNPKMCAFFIQFCNGFFYIVK